MKRIFAAAAILAMTSTGAGATDLSDPFRAPSFRPAPFAGPYAGVQFGGAVEATSVDGLSGLSVGSKGIYGGLTLGYDVPLGTYWMAGLYMSGTYNDIGAHVDEASIDQKWSAKFGGRVGRVFGDTLIYVPLAYTADWMDVSAVNASEYVSGVYSGLGVEHAIGRWSIGFETGAKWSGFEAEGVDADRRSLSAEVTLRRRF